MTHIFQRVLRFLSRKLLIRNREAVHPYFGPMTYYDHGDSSKAYWEAGLSHPQLKNEISVTFRGSPNGPDVAEEAFCREVMSDLDALFSKCSDAFRAEFPAW